MDDFELEIDPSLFEDEDLDDLDLEEYVFDDEEEEEEDQWQLQKKFQKENLTFNFQSFFFLCIFI